MPALQFRFTDLATLTDELHGLFDAWCEAAAAGDVAPADLATLQRLRLAVHEWTANLVQHATFASRPPLVVLSLDPLPDGSVVCAIEDTSDGFDFETTLHRRRHAALAPFPERGMGLRILLASVRDLSYRADPERGHRLAFVVGRSDPTPFIDVLP